jgi:hypothetical protein
MFSGTCSYGTVIMKDLQTQRHERFLVISLSLSLYFGKSLRFKFSHFNMTFLAMKKLITPLIPLRKLQPLIQNACYYHENIIDHYENPRNVGSLNKALKNVGTGVVGAPAWYE